MASNIRHEIELQSKHFRARVTDVTTIRQKSDQSLSFLLQFVKEMTISTRIKNVCVQTTCAKSITADPSAMPSRRARNAVETRPAQPIALS